MKLPENSFKRALAQGQPQFGLWAALADPYVAEVLATAGFDWLLIDIEHAPNDLRSTLGQLQAVAPYATHPVVRPVRSERALIKRLLDIGAQTLLVPMIDTAEQAAEVDRVKRSESGMQLAGVRFTLEPCPRLPDDRRVRAMCAGPSGNRDRTGQSRSNCARGRRGRRLFRAFGFERIHGPAGQGG